MTTRDEWRWTDERGVQRLVRTDELRTALANRVLPPTTLVWRPGLPEWVPASAVPELAGGNKLPVEELSSVTRVLLRAPVAGPEQDSPQASADPTNRRQTRTLTGLASPIPAEEQNGPAGPNVPIVVPAAGGASDRRRGFAITQPPTYGSPNLPPEAMPSIPRPAGLPAPITARGPMGATPAGADRSSEPSAARAGAASDLWSSDAPEDAETQEEPTFIADKNGGRQNPARAPERASPETKPAPAAHSRPPVPSAESAEQRGAPPETLVGGFPALIPRKESHRSATPSSPQKPAQASPKPAAAASSKGADQVVRNLAKAVKGAKEEQTSTAIMAPSPQEVPRQSGSAEPTTNRNLVPRPPPNARFSMRLPPVPTSPSTDPRASASPSKDGPEAGAAGSAERVVGAAAAQVGAPHGAASAPKAEAPAGAPTTRSPTPAPHDLAAPRPIERSGVDGSPNEHLQVKPPAPLVGASSPASPGAFANEDSVTAPHVSSSAAPMLGAARPTAPGALKLTPPIEPRSPDAAALPVFGPQIAAGAASPGVGAKPPAESPGRGRPSLRLPVQVPLSSVVGAGAALILIVVTSFVVGRCSVGGRGKSGETVAARPALFAVPLLARAATPPPPKPCWVARQPVMWAPRVSKSVPFDVVPTSAGAFVVGYARGETEASGIEINAASGEVRESFSKETDEDIERVAPSPGGAEFVVTTQAEGGSMRPILHVPATPPFVIGLGGGSVSLANDMNGSGSPLWPLQGEGDPGAARVQVTGDKGYAVIFRRGDAIWGGFLGPDRKPVGALTQVVGSGGAVGKPMSGWNGRELAVIFADKPSGASRYEIRVGRAPAGSIPASTTVIPLPKGGPGGDAFAPGIAGLSDGRWVLVWTEGSTGNRAIRAQTMTADLAPLGDPIALSPPAGNFGQGVLAVTENYVTVVFLSQGRVSYELWGAMMQCG